MTKPVKPSILFRRAFPAAATVLAMGATGALAANAYAAAAQSTVDVRASDDAYTSSARPTLNNGTSARLTAGQISGDRNVTYLRFKVGIPAGATVKGASLRLTRDEHHLPGTVRLSAVPSVNWSERTLTQRNAPALGSLLGTTHPTSATSVVTFDVGAVVRHAGTYSFAVTSPVTADVARFRADEYGTGQPVLRLTLATSSTPAPSPSTSKPAAPAPSTSPSTAPSTSPTTAPGGCAVNAKLVPSCGLLWGAAAGGFTTTPRDQALREWEAATGRVSSMYHVYHKGDELFPTADEIAMAREPGKPRILMENWRVGWGTTWAKVANGSQDARIDREAAYLKSHFTEKFFLLIHHEPENDVIPTAGSGMTARDYAAMFRHTVQRLRADGVTNAVTMVAYMSYEKWNNQAWWYDLYPGDDVADWIGLDAYVNADPKGFHHGDFTYLVNRTTDASKFPGYYTWVTTQHPNKPFMIAEWGVFEYAADPTQKAKIVDGVLAALKNLPAIKGLTYFDAPNPPGGGDTRVESSAQSKAAFQRLAANPLFQVKVG